MKEQRAHARKMMHEQGFLLDSGGTSWAPVILLDISLRGISFATPEALVTGTVRKLRFSVPGSPALHDSLIHIVRRTTDGVPSGYKIGTMFVTIEPEATQQIADFVSKSAQT